MRGNWAIVGAGVFLSVLLPAAAHAQTQQQDDWCYSNSATDDQTIEGCTGIINSSGQSAAKLASAYANRGYGYHNKHDYDDAIADYDAAIRLNPNDSRAYGNRGLTYGDKGDYDRAIADFSEAIRLDPNNADAYNGRGIAHGHQGDYDRAISDYDEALRLQPNGAGAYTNRLSTQRRLRACHRRLQRSHSD
jgi:tetratricopeptide (TPR) repeat protein